MGLKAGLQFLQKNNVLKQASGVIEHGVSNGIKPNLTGLRYAPETCTDKFVTKLQGFAGFKTKEEIIQHFKNLGVEVRLEDFSPKHLETFNLVRNDIELLRRMGLKDSIPNGVCLSDWRNTEKTKQLLSEYGLDIKFPADRRAYCGAGSNTVFINSSEEALASSDGVFKKFKHEIGHKNHYTDYDSKGALGSNGANSVLGGGVQDNVAFANKQLEILGINARVRRANFPEGYPPIPYQITKPINDKIIPIEGNKILQVDISKMLTYMNNKCLCYNKEWVSEQVAEIFEDLLKGRRFDDLTMLMYDFSGGGRIPNLIIDGKKYDDYIKSLYENKELVNKLKEFITVS